MKGDATAPCRGNEEGGPTKARRRRATPILNSENSSATSVPSRPEPFLKFDCDPCISRTRHQIKVIVHGTASDEFWHHVSSAMRQVGKDMRVALDLQLSDTFDEDEMVRDIDEATDEAVRARGRQPQGEDILNTVLVVTIPTVKVHDAVSRAIAAGMSVFGLNSGYNLVKDLPGLLGYVAMDDYMGGEEAAKSFLEMKNVTRALYVNHAFGNEGLEQRRLGFVHGLNKYQGGAADPNDNLFVSERSAVVHELAIDVNQHPGTIQGQLDKVLRDCSFDAVLLPGGRLLEFVTSAFYHNSCKFDGQSQLLATFDTSSAIYNDIAVGKIAFTISQQQYLQGAITIVLAAVHSTTGLYLAPSAASKFGTYLAGPKVIKLSNLPTDTQQTCESEAFPVCSSSAGGAAASLSTGRCDCIDRSTIKIGGVINGPKFQPFWRPLWSAARQAAIDMNVHLRLDPLEGPDRDVDGMEKLAAKVKSLCDEGVNGVFVPIKSTEIEDAIRSCQDLNIPVISINSGSQRSEEIGTMQHISQLEYRAGFAAGKEMAATGRLEIGYCVNFHLSNDLDDRCFGFRDAICEHNITYGGVLPLFYDSKLTYKTEVERRIQPVATDDSWTGIGLMLVAADFVESSLFVKKDHPEMLLGSFDHNDLLYEGINNGDILFGIDQQQYLQGYLPVVLLTWYSFAKQSLVNHFLETGPHLILSAPSDKAGVFCTTNHFEVCPVPQQYYKHQLDQVRPAGLAIATVVILTSLIFAIWVIIYSDNRVVKASQPVFLLGICLGTVVMAGTIIPLGLDDGVLRTDGGCVNCDCKSCDVACMAAPWLLSLGFSLVFASLFSKIWRVNKLERSSRRFRRVVVSFRDVVVPLVALLVADVVIMLVWTLMDPMYWSRTQRCGSDEFTSYGSCVLGAGNVSLASASSVVAVNVAAVVLANFQAFKARTVDTAYSESGYIALAMASILQVILVGVPLMFLVQDNPPAKFFVEAGVIGVICMSVLLFIFVPKMASVQELCESSDVAKVSDALSAVPMSEFTHSVTVSRLRRSSTTISFVPTAPTENTPDTKSVAPSSETIKLYYPTDIG